jgi:hypothetical protein
MQPAAGRVTMKGSWCRPSARGARNSAAVATSGCDLDARPLSHPGLVAMRIISFRFPLQSRHPANTSPPGIWNPFCGEHGLARPVPPPVGDRWPVRPGRRTAANRGT